MGENMEKDLTIVIPAYEPDDKLITLVEQLNSSLDIPDIIVVDDGSKDKNIFESLKKYSNVILLCHEVNKGKGAALKTAFKYIDDNMKERIVVTADSDGQHSPDDIVKVYNFSKKYNKSLILGSRAFEGDVPKKSMFGNNVTRFLMRLVFEHPFLDTQTGLRAFSSNLIPFLLKIKGERYEYEMNMLAEAIKSDIKIREVKIKTIYNDGNKGTHFNPVKDFTKITLSILKYVVPFMLSIIAQILFYFIFSYLISHSFNPNQEIFVISVLLSDFFAFFFHMLLSLTGLCNGNTYIFKNIHMGRKYLFTVFTLIALSCGFTFVFCKLLSCDFLSFILADVAVIIWCMLFNYFVVHKAKFEEE
jgi:glycosyltransferase involved in cell wall biosynthesis